MNRHGQPEPTLAPSEWRVFFLLSRRQPMTVAEIAQELARLDPELARSYNTVKTFAERLCRKGYLRREPQPVTSGAGREAFAYSLAVPFEDALKLHVHRFLDQFALGGKADLDVIRRALVDRCD
jgi:predicted transcriptional regulator